WPNSKIDPPEILHREVLNRSAGDHQNDQLKIGDHIKKPARTCGNTTRPGGFVRLWRLGDLTRTQKTRSGPWKNSERSFPASIHPSRRRSSATAPAAPGNSTPSKSSN